MLRRMFGPKKQKEVGKWGSYILRTFIIIARTVLEDICNKPVRIQSYCAVARLHGV
jgi:hypothetical protein